MPPVRRSPGKWIEFLEPRLDYQARRLATFENYYDGEHRLAYATAKFREAFSRWFPPMADNWMQIIVDSSVERLRVQGFRFGEAGTEPDRTGKSADQLLA